MNPIRHFKVEYELGKFGTQQHLYTYLPVAVCDAAAFTRLHGKVSLWAHLDDTDEDILLHVWGE